MQIYCPKSYLFSLNILSSIVTTLSCHFMVNGNFFSAFVCHAKGTAGVFQSSVCRKHPSLHISSLEKERFVWQSFSGGLPVLTYRRARLCTYVCGFRWCFGVRVCISIWKIFIYQVYTQCHDHNFSGKSDTMTQMLFVEWLSSSQGTLQLNSTSS